MFDQKEVFGHNKFSTFGLTHGGDCCEGSMLCSSCFVSKVASVYVAMVNIKRSNGAVRYVSNCSHSSLCGIFKGGIGGIADQVHHTTCSLLSAGTYRVW